MKTKCILCNSSETTEVLNLGNQPLANKYPRGEGDFQKEDFFPLAVLHCTRCKNFQLGTVVSRERMFEDYYYLSSVNPGLVRHFETFAKEIKDSNFVVDIGSNDGILLKPLKELGVRAIGVDPSINVGKIANDAGLETIVAFFDMPTAEMIKSRYQKPDMVVASSIFTHLDNPHPFIDAVKSMMTDDGKFVIEVEYIGNIIKNVQFERFYLDRVFYYSLASLKNLFEAHSLRVSDVEEIEPHGGSIRVTVCKDAKPSDRVIRFLEKEKTDLAPAKLQEFRDKVDSYIKDFRNKLIEYKKSGLKVAGYGAPARVATISNYGKIGPELVGFIVDDSPLKQNRFSPGKHIPIVPQEYLEKNSPDILVVFAHEYFDDIKKKTGGRFRYLFPVPPREVI